MLKTYKASVKKLPEGMQVEANARNFKIYMDEPEDFSGTNAAMTPVEALLCALGGCQAIVASSFAPAYDFTFEEFYVELEGDMDPDGFTGLSDARNGFQEIRFVMHFKTDEPKEKVEDFAKFIEKTCPVGDNLENGVKLVLSDVVID